MICSRLGVRNVYVQRHGDSRGSHKMGIGPAGINKWYHRLANPNESVAFCFPSYCLHACRQTCSFSWAALKIASPACTDWSLLENDCSSTGQHLPSLCCCWLIIFVHMELSSIFYWRFLALVVWLLLPCWRYRSTVTVLQRIWLLCCCSG